MRILLGAPSKKNYFSLYKPRRIAVKIVTELEQVSSLQEFKKENNEEMMMKKLLIALAILAVAATAQAELLATWSGSNSGTVTLPGGTGVVVSDITAYGSPGITTSSGDTWGMNGLDVAGNGLQFTITSITAGWYINNAVVSGTVSGSGTGPASMDWYVGAAMVASIDRATTTAQAFNSNLGALYSGDVVSLQVDLDAGTVRSGAADPVQSGGSFRIRTGGTGGTMQLAGDVTAIPEPATMSLLGIGAVAMLIRRKMKK